MGWINVIDRLPENEDENCLWFWSDGYITLNKMWEIRGWLGRNITYWMPLPEPPTK